MLSHLNPSDTDYFVGIARGRSRSFSASAETWLSVPDIPDSELESIIHFAGMSKTRATRIKMIITELHKDSE